MPSYHWVCCCGKGCTSCNDCTSDYSPFHGQNNDPGCFARSLKVTLADIFPNEGPIPSYQGRVTTQRGGNDFYFTGLDGPMNGDYTLHQTPGGYVRFEIPSPILPTFDTTGQAFVIDRSELRVYLSYSGLLQIQLYARVLIYSSYFPPSGPPSDEAILDVQLLATQFDLAEQFVRCLDIEATDNGTGNGVAIPDPDEEVPDGEEPTLVPYVTRWGDGNPLNEPYLDEQGNAKVTICGDDDQSPQDPFNPDEIATAYSVSSTGSISVLSTDGVTVIQSCQIKTSASPHYRETTAAYPPYSGSQRIFGKPPRTFDQLSTPIVDYTGQKVGTPAFCSYLNQITLNLIDGEWQLRIGPPPGVILYKSNSYGPIGQWGDAYGSYEDPASGETILVDVTGVYVG